MITNLKNDRLLFLIKGKKYPYKHRNKYLLCWLSVIILLVLAAVFVYGLMKYTYGKLDICDLSARTIYKNGIEPIEDQNYFEEKNVNTNSNGDIVPELELNNKVLTLNPNDIKGVYLAWVYTGNERFEYNGNYQWKELIETGKKFNYNTGYGYRTAYDTKEVELSENGWYTVFAIWHEGGQKLHIAKNFHVGSIETSGIGTEYEKEAYETWQDNKKYVNSVKGVKNYLFIGADHWNRSELTKSYSDYMVLATVNTNNREVSFTTVLKESYVYIPTIGCGRLTNAYNCGGVELVVRTIEENYGLKIDNYLLLDYNYFIQMINAVDGIKVQIEKYQVPYINQYISDLESDYRLTSDIVKTEYLEEKSGEFLLDGAQTLAYIRYYNEGDWARGERYDMMMKGFYKSLCKTSLFTIVNDIFPLFTTDFSFDEYKEFLYCLPLYLKYDVKVYELPSENRVAPFKESYRYNVLLNKRAETDAVISNILNDKDVNRRRIWWISPILVIIYIYLLMIALTALCYTIFRKSRIIYTDPVTDEKRYKSKKYRWNSDVHVYHHDVLGEYDGGLFMNKEMTQMYSHKIKMPMHDLLVYVHIPVNDVGDYSEDKDKKTYEKI